MREKSFSFWIGNSKTFFKKENMIRNKKRNKLTNNFKNFKIEKDCERKNKLLQIKIWIKSWKFSPNSWNHRIGTCCQIPFFNAISKKKTNNCKFSPNFQTVNKIETYFISYYFFLSILDFFDKFEVQLNLLSFWKKIPKSWYFKIKEKTWSPNFN
jgi:hypothetical protein